MCHIIRDRLIQRFNSMANNNTYLNNNDVR